MKKQTMGKRSLVPLSLVFFHMAVSVAAGTTVELWCVAKNNAADSALQTALNWACGEGRVDCGPIQPGGPCYDSSDVQSMASYAFNAYFLNNAMANHSCYFDNSAALTSLDPSHDKCKFPSSLAVSNGTMPSPSTATVGFGPSENYSGVARLRFYWPLFVANVLVFCSSCLIWDAL